MIGLGGDQTLQSTPYLFNIQLDGLNSGWG